MQKDGVPIAPEQGGGVVPYLLLPNFQVQLPLPSFNKLMNPNGCYVNNNNPLIPEFNNNNNINSNNHISVNTNKNPSNVNGAYDNQRIQSSRSAFSSVPTSNTVVPNPNVGINSLEETSNVISPALEHIRQEHIRVQSNNNTIVTPLLKPAVAAFNNNTLSVKSTNLKKSTKKNSKSSSTIKNPNSNSTSSLTDQGSLNNNNPSTNTNIVNSNSATTNNLNLNQNNNGRLEKEQREQLRKVFEMSVYLSGKERKALADSLGIPEKKVQIWFQNERAKMKRRQQQVLVKQGIGSSTTNGILSLLEEEGRGYKDPNNQIQGLQRLQGLQGFQAMQRNLSNSNNNNSKNNNNNSSNNNSNPDIRGLEALIAAGNENSDSKEDNSEDEEQEREQEEQEEEQEEKGRGRGREELGGTNF